MTESARDLVRKGFEDFSRRLIAQGVTSSEEAVRRMIQMCEGFRTDKIFQEQFPLVFMIELSHRNLEKNDTTPSANDAK